MDLDESVANWCVATLGAAPVRELFRRSHLSEVIGLELGDGRQIVLKIRPPSPRLESVTAVQRHVHGKGYPCPAVLAGPMPLGERIATAEEYIAPHGASPDPPRTAPVAELLAELVHATPPPETAPALKPAPPWVGWDHPGHQLWPWPDDLDIDMNTHPGPDWVDDTAERIRDRMREDRSRPVIGHIDWEAHNLDWIGGTPVMVHDWDSLAIQAEAASPVRRPQSSPPTARPPSPPPSIRAQRSSTPTAAGGSMRRQVGALFVTLVVAVLLAACSGDSDVANGRSDREATAGGVEELRPKAAEITDRLAANEWAKVRSQFDDNMKQELAEDVLANAWAQVVKSKGEYVSRGEPTQLGSPAGKELLVFDTPLEFERGAMKSRLTFNADRTIAGLFILVPEA